MANGRLLIVLSLPIYCVSNRYAFDAQACRGLRLWLDNFEYLTLACPLRSADHPPSSCVWMDEVVDADMLSRITIVPLPYAYLPHRFIMALPQTVQLLKFHIQKSNYLHFAIGGLWGDWASVSCLIAHKLRLPYAVWTDRVESSITEFHSMTKRGIRKSYSLATAKLMRFYERYIISRSSLGLFHGMNCYEAYSKYCNNSHVVHNIHLGVKDQISDRQLEDRLRDRNGLLRLVYVGRAHFEKGVFDWIDSLAIAAKDGVEFKATWFGDGPALETARSRVEQLGLSSRIFFPGLLDHDEVLNRLRASDAFVFCHKTSESPRCLIEALASGLPIIGYDRAYPRDLIRHGGGLLSPINDLHQIARSLAAIQDQFVLRDISRRAMMDGKRFTAEQVFRHRSELLKTIRVSNS